MSRLSELKSSPDVGRPERTVTVCVSGKLVRELEAAAAELQEAQQELAAERFRVGADDEEPKGPPKRVGERSRIPELEQRVADLTAKADGIQGRMRENSVALLLRAIDQGAWRRWVLEHPARTEWVRTGGTDDDPTGDERVVARDRLAAGVCDLDALAEDLGRFIAEYDGEPASDDWWAFLSENGAGGDMISAASHVVALHENNVNVGKAPKPSPGNRGSETA